MNVTREVLVSRSYKLLGVRWIQHPFCKPTKGGEDFIRCNRIALLRRTQRIARTIKLVLTEILKKQHLIVAKFVVSIATNQKDYFVAKIIDHPAQRPYLLCITDT